jgi:hypothetical protein
MRKGMTVVSIAAVALSMSGASFHDTPVMTTWDYIECNGGPGMGGDWSVGGEVKTYLTQPATVGASISWEIFGDGYGDTGPIEGGGAIDEREDATFAHAKLPSNPAASGSSGDEYHTVEFWIEHWAEDLSSNWYDWENLFVVVACPFSGYRDGGH